MPAGLKETSSLISVSFQLNESAPNTFTQQRVDMQLNPLDQEVFIVYAVNLDPFSPDAVDGVNTRTFSSLTTTSQTAVANLGVSNCLANANEQIQSFGPGIGGIGFVTSAGETPASTLEYIGIIATSDCFVQVQGVGNINARGVSGRMYGIRAKASSSIYAALVQSEILSS